MIAQGDNSMRRLIYSKSSCSKPGNKGKGFSLVEVLITLAITAIAALGIISALVFSHRSEADLRQRNAAFREGSAVMESTKKSFFNKLSPSVVDVLIDSKGTVSPDDDLMGVAQLQFFDMNNIEVGGDGVAIPDDGQMILARVTVRWVPPGRAGNEQSIAIESLLAPP